MTRRNKPVYVYLVPKSKWPKKVVTLAIVKDINEDKDAKTGKSLGYEFLWAHSVEVDGEEVA